MHSGQGAEPCTVSVVVPTYRRSDDLHRALESLTRQTHASLEVIVVDDNSDDEWCARVERSIESLRGGSTEFVYVRNEVSSGSAAARNVGISYATGEYVTFLDDDDLYLPEKVRHQLEYMQSTGADYSITDLRLLSESGRLIEYRKRDYIHDTDATSLMRYHYMYHMTGTDTLMFKTEYLRRIGGFPGVGMGDEFYLICAAISGGGVFAYLPECDVQAFVHSARSGKSSGQRKIDFENALYEQKRARFPEFDYATRSYISMRHWAVLSFAEYRRRRPGPCVYYGLRAFAANPLQCMELMLHLK